MECMLMIMEFANNALQHARHATDLDQINARHALMDFISHMEANIVHNVLLVVLNAIHKASAQNAMIIITKDQMEIASDAMNHVENAKEIQIIALHAEVVITSMVKNVVHAIQIAKNAQVQEIFVQNVMMVNISMIESSVSHVLIIARNAQAVLLKNAQNVQMDIV